MFKLIRSNKGALETVVMAKIAMVMFFAFCGMSAAKKNQVNKTIDTVEAPAAESDYAFSLVDGKFVRNK